MHLHYYAVGQCFPHCMLDSNEIVRLIGSFLRVLFTMMLQAMCMQKSAIRLFLLVIKRAGDGLLPVPVSPPPTYPGSLYLLIKGSIHQGCVCNFSP